MLTHSCSASWWRWTLRARGFAVQLYKSHRWYELSLLAGIWCPNWWSRGSSRALTTDRSDHMSGNVALPVAGPKAWALSKKAWKIIRDKRSGWWCSPLQSPEAADVSSHLCSRIVSKKRGYSELPSWRWRAIKDVSMKIKCGREENMWEDESHPRYGVMYNLWPPFLPGT